MAAPSAASASMIRRRCILQRRKVGREVWLVVAVVVMFCSNRRQVYIRLSVCLRNEESGHLECVKVLLQNNANPNSKNAKMVI